LPWNWEETGFFYNIGTIKTLDFGDTWRWTKCMLNCKAAMSPSSSEAKYYGLNVNCSFMGNVNAWSPASGSILGDSENFRM
jgi:hypothetical protein